ncbi:MAG: DUF438 domain-containing protein [Bryobacteraceae bacterium]|nr:DUF438 domain-containing protein [Bryobacteraceae bacterium]
MSEVINNREHRILALKSVIERLHAGEPPEQVKGVLKDIVRQTDYSEIVAMEEQLMAEGMPVEEVKSMCDLHSQVTRDILVQLPARALPPGHPVDTFRRENEALRGVAFKMRGVMAEIGALPDDAAPEALVQQWRQSFNELMDIDKHYQRKEHALFPFLERHGITGPSKVMWAKDDDVRALLKDLGEALGQRGATAAEWKLVAASVADAALSAIEEMIYKEENILLPMCLNTFTDDEWAEIWASSPRYGWCLVEPREGYRPPQPAVREGLRLPPSDTIMLPTGNLSLDQLVRIFSTMPLDLTFVDADDRVCFFSEGPHRVFARSKAIIGRKVQHCHPPRSVDVVDRILTDFREGRQSVAEFWINFHGRFAHIRYFAVRDGEGKYMGTLEVTQDVTGIRALEGERRLLQYDGVAQ